MCMVVSNVFCVSSYLVADTSGFCSESKHSAVGITVVRVSSICRFCALLSGGQQIKQPLPRVTFMAILCCTIAVGVVS